MNWLRRNQHFIGASGWLALFVSIGWFSIAATLSKDTKANVLSGLWGGVIGAVVPGLLTVVVILRAQADAKASQLRHDQAMAQAKADAELAAQSHREAMTQIEEDRKTTERHRKEDAALRHRTVIHASASVVLAFQTEITQNLMALERLLEHVDKNRQRYPMGSGQQLLISVADIGQAGLWHQGMATRLPELVEHLTPMQVSVLMTYRRDVLTLAAHTEHTPLGRLTALRDELRLMESVSSLGIVNEWVLDDEAFNSRG